MKVKVRSIKGTIIQEFENVNVTFENDNRKFSIRATESVLGFYLEIDKRHDLSQEIKIIPYSKNLVYIE